jgi:hypothetical protein
MRALSTLFVIMGALSGLGAALGLITLVRGRGFDFGLYLLVAGVIGAILWFGLSAALNAIARIEEMVTEMRHATIKPLATRAPAPPSDRMSESTS